MASCGFENAIFHYLLISLKVLKISYLQELSNLLYAVLYTGFFRSAWFLALAKTYSFAIFGVALAVANCKCVWLLAWDLPLII
jgi:hypothetical protein